MRRQMEATPSASRTRAWVEIDLGALRRNALTLAERAGVPLLPMVKADAYGLGAVRVAKALDDDITCGFGVATVAEGMELRAAGITKPIIVFTPVVAPAALRELRAAGLTPALGSAAAIETWEDVGGGDWHLAIDTGMTRAGVRWDELVPLLPQLRSAPPRGAFTHFHSADVDDGSMQLQLERFQRALEMLPERPELLHTSNSAGIARESRSRFSFVRPGIFLYGGSVGQGAAVQPEPVVSLRAPVVDLHWAGRGDSVSYGASFKPQGMRWIATLAVGYADGYRRALGNRASVLLRGKRVPVVGVVTMDMTMVDITDYDAEVGEVITLIGRDGDDEVTIDELAQRAGTISYELLVSLALRAERVYREAGA